MPLIPIAIAAAGGFGVGFFSSSGLEKLFKLGLLAGGGYLTYQYFKDK